MDDLNLCLSAQLTALGVCMSDSANESLDQLFIKIKKLSLSYHDQLDIETEIISRLARVQSSIELFRYKEYLPCNDRIGQVINTCLERTLSVELSEIDDIKVLVYEYWFYCDENSEPEKLINYRIAELVVEADVYEIIDIWPYSSGSLEEIFESQLVYLIADEVTYEAQPEWFLEVINNPVKYTESLARLFNETLGRKFHLN